MEYTKDLILNVNYGQAGAKHKWHIFETIWDKVTKHKLISSIISITIVLMLLDFVLIQSFISVLNSI